MFGEALNSLVCALALTSNTNANDAAFYALTTFPDFFSLEHETFVLCCDRLETIFLGEGTNNSPINGAQRKSESRNALMFDRLQLVNKEENVYLRGAAATNLSEGERNNDQIGGFTSMPGQRQENNKYYGNQQGAAKGYNFAPGSNKQSANGLKTAPNNTNDPREAEFETKAHAEATVTSRILISIAPSLSFLNLKMLLGFYSRIGQIGEFFRVLGAKIRTLRVVLVAAKKPAGVASDLVKTRLQLEIVREFSLSLLAEMRRQISENGRPTPLAERAVDGLRHSITVPEKTGNTLADVLSRFFPRNRAHAPAYNLKNNSYTNRNSNNNINGSFNPSINATRNANITPGDNNSPPLFSNLTDTELDHLFEYSLARIMKVRDARLTCSALRFCLEAGVHGSLRRLNAANVRALEQRLHTFSLNRASANYLYGLAEAVVTDQVKKNRDDNGNDSDSDDNCSDIDDYSNNNDYITNEDYSNYNNTNETNNGYSQRESYRSGESFEETLSRLAARLAHCDFAPAENFLLPERADFFKRALRHLDRAPNAASRVKDRAALLREAEDCELQVLLNKELQDKVEICGLEKWTSICGLNTICSTELLEKAQKLSTTLFAREQLLSEFARPFCLFEAQIEFDCRSANKQPKLVDLCLLELIKLCAERNTDWWPINWQAVMERVVALPGFDPYSLDWSTLIHKIELTNHKHQNFYDALANLHIVIKGMNVEGLNDSEKKGSDDSHNSHYENDNRENCTHTQPEQQSYFVGEPNNYNHHSMPGMKAVTLEDGDQITRFANFVRIRRQPMANQPLLFHSRRYRHLSVEHQLDIIGQLPELHSQDPFWTPGFFLQPILMNNSNNNTNDTSISINETPNAINADSGSRKSLLTPQQLFKVYATLLEHAVTDSVDIYANIIFVFRLVHSLAIVLRQWDEISDFSLYWSAIQTEALQLWEAEARIISTARITRVFFARCDFLITDNSVKKWVEDYLSHAESLLERLEAWSQQREVAVLLQGHGVERERQRSNDQRIEKGEATVKKMGTRGKKKD